MRGKKAKMLRNATQYVTDFSDKPIPTVAYQNWRPPQYKDVSPSDSAIPHFKKVRMGIPCELDVSFRKIYQDAKKDYKMS